MIRLTSALVAAWLALGALAAAALTRGWTDLIAFGPRQSLLRPLASGDPAAQAAVREQLQRARALEPGNPNTRELLAQWYERAALRLPPNQPLAKAYREQALVHLRAAAWRRPGSPYAWASIALLKQQLGAVDAELADAVRNAARLGPWEPEVQLALAEVAFRARNALPPDALALAKRGIANGLTRQDRQIFDLALRFGALDFLCSISGVTVSPLALRCI